MTTNPLTKEFDFYQQNQKKLVKQYGNKYVVIKDEHVIGVYNTDFEAYTETQKEHELGTFLIQLVQLGEENYSQTFYSRVAI
jgi:hypothetical protein